MTHLSSLWHPLALAKTETHSLCLEAGRSLERVSNQYRAVPRGGTTSTTRPGNVQQTWHTACWRKPRVSIYLSLSVTVQYQYNLQFFCISVSSSRMDTRANFSSSSQVIAKNAGTGVCTETFANTFPNSWLSSKESHHLHRLCVFG